MTALDSSPAADTGSPIRIERGTFRAETRDVPALVAGTQLFGAQRGSGYRVAPHLARRADGQVLQLTPLIYAVLAAIDSNRDVDAVASAAGDIVARELHPDDVHDLIDDKLRPLGLVLGRDGTHPPMRKSNPLLALRARFVVAKPELTRRVTAPFAILFNPLVVTVATVAFAVIGYWVLFRKGLASAAYDAFNRPGPLLAVFALTVVSAGFHEFGHAAALRRGGGTPGAMGAGLYLIYPAFYTDVTDSYRLGRGARIRTDLGGLYFNALVAVATFGLWLAIRWDGLLLVIAAQILQMVRQLPPLIRCDGYHIIADLIGVPDLYQRIGPTLRSFVPVRRWRSDARELRLWARVVVTAWTLFVVPILTLTILLSVIALPRILGTTAHSVAVQWHQLTGRAHGGDIAGAGANILAIAALVIPVGGIMYLLVRMVPRHSVQVWRRTKGKPRKRAVACVALAAILCGLAFEWWPRTGTYAPIRPGERGTVQDALPVAAHRSLIPQTSGLAGEGLRAGNQRSTVMAWPSGMALPTRARPALALVIVPRVGDGPTWMFPFARPLPAGPGDNQALAVAMRDGGVSYDVAFALVWADGSSVVNANTAYAFASCRQCVAVAVSFQVVLVASDANVVAPVNAAVAVNYRCYKCVTLAVAVQLVAQLRDSLDPVAVAALTKLWARIVAWSRHIQGLTLAQIQAMLRRFEEQILAIVKPAIVAATVASSAASASPTPSATGTPSPATSSSAGTTGATPSETASSAPPSESPSSSPSSASPTPTPTPTPSASSSP
jgi:putative peptide zinc metalloprotease protein